MKKHKAKIVFKYNGNGTSFHTENKEFASMVLKELSKIVLTEDEMVADTVVRSFVFDNTTLLTHNLHLALKVLNYIRENAEDPLEEEIKEIKKEIKEQKHANTKRD